MHLHLFTTGVLLSGLLSLATAASNVTYNVIATPGHGNAVGVMVGGTTYELSQDKDTAVLYTGKAPSGNYSYVLLDQQKQTVAMEAFHRNAVDDATPNEFFNRTWNSKNPALFPTILDALPSMRVIDTKSKLHPTGEIPTIYLRADQGAIDALHGNSSSTDKVSVTFTYIENDKVQHFNGSELKLAGRSSRWVDKLSYALEIPKEGKDDLYGFRRLKLRAMRMDPSYIREQIVYDLMNSVGLPVSGASYVRLIINDRPIGLFTLIEAYKGTYLRNQFNGGKKFDQGTLFKGVGFSSDLMPMANMTDYAGAYEVEDKPDKGNATMEKVVKLTQFLYNAPVGDGAEDEWNKYLDVESFIRALAIEVTAGFSDGFMTNANNYFLYDNLQEGRFTYTAADFDTTLGLTMFKIDKMWAGDYHEFPGFLIRNATAKLLQVPAFKSRFEDVFHKVITELATMENVNARIDGLVDLIQQDVTWDMALPKVTTINYDDSSFQEILNFNVSALPVPMDPDTIKDMSNPKRLELTWLTAVNGPTGLISLSGVREWFQHRTNNTLQYFQQNPIH
ncbi:coth protein-domain-containing protein [Gongronella butleri]|nr:coth protein-domain-containing protein [Gongronella butleri]